MDLIDIRNKLNKGENIYSIPLRVVYYARVSTDHDEQLHSLAAQVKYFEDFIRKNQNWTFIDGYIDEGISGSSVNKRESFPKMIEDAHLRKFDFIITKEISRFSRNTLDSIKYTQQLLNDGVGVFFQSDSINTLMPDSELRLTIMASIAQEEIRRLSERVKFGIKQSTKSGVVWGNNNILGYTKNDGKLVIDEEEAKVVRMIFDMYAIQNMGMRKICNKLAETGIYNSLGNAYNPRSIRGFLANPKYKGYYVANKTQKYDHKSSKRKHYDKNDWIVYKDEESVPPIVSEELWDLANGILDKRSENSHKKGMAAYKNKYAYSGKIVCVRHDEFYYRRLAYYPSGNKEFWRCRMALTVGKHACDSPAIYKDELDEIMRDVCEAFITNKDEITKELAKIYISVLGGPSLAIDIARLENEILKVQAKKEKLLELAIEGRITNAEFEKRNDRFNSDIEKINGSIEGLKAQMKMIKETEYNLELLENVISSKIDFKNDLTNELIDSLVDRIEVYECEDRKTIKLKVYLRISSKGLEYEVSRKRKGDKNISVCETQHRWACRP